MNTLTVTKENRTVVINQNNEGGVVWASLYVNTRNGMSHATATGRRWTGKTIKGAKKWAEKVLSE